MSKSYDRNIERLKANQAQISAQERGITTTAAQQRGDYEVKHAQEISSKLTPFSKKLQEWKDEDIKKKTAEGVAAARKARTDKAKWLNENGSETAKRLYQIEEAKKVGELAFEFEDAKAQDLEYHKLKELMLKQGGTGAYPDADRITQLSPWQQVGFAQEQIRQKMLGYEDQLAHSMQNGTEPISIGGIQYTAAEIKDNNLAFPMKQAAIEVYADKIYSNLGLDRYSDEMIKLSKVNETIQKAKDSQLSKYREQYNIESSMNTRAKASMEWKRSDKTAVDLQHLLIKTSNTANQKGVLLGRTGGWAEVEKIITNEGIAKQNPEYAETILNQPMPSSMARELGVKQGTTFAQQWPSKVGKLKKAIKKGYADEVKSEETYLKAGGIEKSNEFIAEARKGDLSTARVNEYKREFAALGLPIPSSITNYETATMRDEREDKQSIEYLMASQDGYISNDQLDQFHPKAALEFREKAAKMEKEALKAHDSEAKIKAHMDTAFTNMGIKANEKSPAYVEAMSNAKADYAEKYNRYIGMGYSSAQASHLALHAQQVTDKETGEVLPDSMGVLTEIKTHGEGSKYVVTGQAIEKELKPGHLRVARVASGKREMLDDPDIIFNGTIGGDYGHRQITSVKNNLEKYGVRKGLRMDKGAMQYYKGLARGRDDNWMGLLDKQLKATGHEGLWPEERPAAVDLLSGENGQGEKLEDPNNLSGLTKSANQAFKYPSINSYLYGMNQLKEGGQWGQTVQSVWDTLANMDPMLDTSGGWHTPEPTYEEYLDMLEQGRWPRDKIPPKSPRDKGPIIYTTGGAP